MLSPNQATVSAAPPPAPPAAPRVLVRCVRWDQARPGGVEVLRDQYADCPTPSSLYKWVLAMLALCCPRSADELSVWAPPPDGRPWQPCGRMELTGLAYETAALLADDLVDRWHRRAARQSR